MKKALVIGASSGLGNALAARLLQTGYEVFVLGRSSPENLAQHPNFRFAQVDFELSRCVDTAIGEALDGWPLDRLDYVFLNSGRFSQAIAPLSEVSQEDVESLLAINVFGHKRVLDNLLKRGVGIGTCVLSSSIAGVRARAGNSGYALSKAMFNMMGKLYALEHPGIFFLVLGMCNVETHLSHTIGTLPLEGWFPEIEQLRARAKDIPGYIVSAQQRALDVMRLLDGDVRATVPSGDFVEIRSLLARLPVDDRSESIHA